MQLVQLVQIFALPGQISKLGNSHDPGAVLTVMLLNFFQIVLNMIGYGYGNYYNFY